MKLKKMLKSKKYDFSVVLIIIKYFNKLFIKYNK